MENKMVIFQGAVILLLLHSGASLESVLVGRLPESLYSSHVFYDGVDSAYLFGGVTTDELVTNIIQRFNLTSGKTDEIGKLPNYLCFGAIADDGIGNPIIVGGTDTTNAFRTVLHYNLANESMSEMRHLFEPLHFHTAASDGLDHFYIFGGAGFDTSFRYNIIKYNIDQKIPSIIVAQLGEYDGILLATAAAFRNSTYLFGGTTQTMEFSKNVTQFTPRENNKVDVLENIFEEGFTGATAITVGDFIYIIGGISKFEHVAVQISRFDPASNTVKKFELVNFPQQLYQASTFYAKHLNRIYIIGGKTRKAIQDEVYYIQL